MAEEERRNNRDGEAAPSPKSGTATETKGVVDESQAKSYEHQLKRLTGQETGGPKGLPHEQVPQPGDFSSEALVRLVMFIHRPNGHRLPLARVDTPTHRLAHTRDPFGVFFRS